MYQMMHMEVPIFIVCDMYDIHLQTSLLPHFGTNYVVYQHSSTPTHLESISAGNDVCGYPPELKTFAWNGNWHFPKSIIFEYVLHRV